jgi:hypothetical protein
MSVQNLVIYDSTKSLLAQSIMSAGIASVYSSGLGAATTYKDFAGLSTGQITSYLSGLTANSLDNIFICVAQAAATVTVHQMFVDDIAALDPVLKSSVRGSTNDAINSGTCQANVTATNIILATTASAITDAYKGMYIATTVGGVTVYHYCSGYNGTSKIATINSATTTITSTSTYVVYKQPNVFTIGDMASSLTPTYDAWNTLFPSISPPPLVSLMSGTGTVNSASLQPHLMVTQTADSFTISSVTKSAAFTNQAYNRGTFYLAVESATTGAGQITQILSNTASVLTIVPFNTLPTGTLVFQICAGNAFCLYETYLKYAVETYLANFTLSTTLNAWQQMLDMLNVIPKGSLVPTYNASLLDMYAKRGKAVFDTISAGYVTV